MWRRLRRLVFLVVGTAFGIYLAASGKAVISYAETTILESDTPSESTSVSSEAARVGEPAIIAPPTYIFPAPPSFQTNREGSPTVQNLEEGQPQLHTLGTLPDTGAVDGGIGFPYLFCEGVVANYEEQVRNGCLKNALD